VVPAASVEPEAGTLQDSTTDPRSAVLRGRGLLEMAVNQIRTHNNAGKTAASLYYVTS